MRRSLSQRAQNTIPERARTDGTKVGARRGFLALRHRFGHAFSRKTGRILFWKLARIWGRPFFTVPEIHATRIPKSTLFWKLFFHLFLWVLDPDVLCCFRMPVFLCRATKNCKLSISPRNFQQHRPREHRFNNLDFPRKIPTPDPICPRATRTMIPTKDLSHRVFQNGHFGCISSTQYFVGFQSLVGLASARQMLRKPCFRQLQCFMQPAPLTRTCDLCPPPHLGFSDEEWFQETVPQHSSRFFGPPFRLSEESRKGGDLNPKERHSLVTGMTVQ